MATEMEPDAKRLEMKKSVTLLNGVTIIVGCIIGSGIFITPGSALIYSGSPGASLVIWALSGIFSMLGALSFAELGTTVRRSGGDYAYILEAFGPLAGFIYLWINIVVVRPLLLTIVNLSFGYYASKPFLNLEHLPEAEAKRHTDIVAKIIAALGLMLLMVVNCVSVRLTMKLQDIFTAAKLIALGGIIACGAYKLAQGHTENFQNAFEGTNTGKDLSLAFYSGLFAFAGWNFLNFVTEEMKNPNRNLPLAIIIAMPIVTLVYLLTNVAYLSVLTPAEIKFSLAVAFDFSQKIDPRLVWVMPFFVALSAIGSANGILFTSGRILLIGAQEKQLPEVFAMIHVKALTPVPAILSLGLISMIYLTGKDLGSLINFFCFIFFFFIGQCILALIFLRFKRKDLIRPIKLNICLHIFCFLVCLFLVISPILSKPKDIGLMGLISLATAFPVYYLSKKWGNKLACTNSISRTLQEILLITSPDKVANSLPIENKSSSKL